jgi:nitrite reductase/ring-hydroxylating ferredoxin subunit
MNDAQPSAGVVLCALDEIPDPGARGFAFRAGEHLFMGLVVRRGGALAGFVDRCPHNGTPLAVLPNRYLTRERDLLLCATHGALFRPDDGVCVAGPCEGRSLWPWPVAVAGDYVVTA